MHVKKGCDLLLRAFHRVLAEGRSTNFQLVMAGPHDGAYGEEMLRLTQELSLGDRVTWTGMLSGDLKWGAFYAAETFVLPSHQENFGVSVVEALACGRPVLISNKVNIWREVSEDGAGLVDEDDLPGTVRLLERWAAIPETERGQMARRGPGLVLRGGSKWIGWLGRSGRWFWAKAYRAYKVVSRNGIGDLENNFARAEQLVLLNVIKNYKPFKRFT